jgi:hypothetical protein
LNARFGKPSVHSGAKPMPRPAETGRFTMRLFLALLWERDRVRNGEREGVHGRCTSENLSAAVDCIERSCRMIEIED